MAPHTTPLGATACLAQVDAATGRAAQAATALRTALLANPQASAPERLWSLTRLAETEERRGDFVAAEAAFRDALALGLPDVYVQAAYADFLLDRGRPAEVLTLLQDRGRADVLLLRLALAARATGDPRAAGHAQELQARFDAARRRGDTSHRKEESRFALALQGDAPRALALARENWAEQREAADARILLEAALAARDAAAAAPVLQWLADSGFESVVLQSLAARVRELG
jgi:Tfp pilus assembly protein PilF